MSTEHYTKNWADSPSGHCIDIILYCACIVHIILWTVDHFCLSFDRLIVYSLKYDVYDALNII